MAEEAGHGQQSRLLCLEVVAAAEHADTVGEAGLDSLIGPPMQALQEVGPRD